MKQIAKFACIVVGFIRSQAPRATVRTVGTDDVEALLRAHERLLAAHPGCGVRSRLVGGFVANSYGSPAEGDFFEVYTDTDGGMTFRAERGRAQCRPYGRGSLVTHHLLQPGQVQGKLVQAPAPRLPRAAKAAEVSA